MHADYAITIILFVIVDAAHCLRVATLLFRQLRFSAADMRYMLRYTRRRPRTILDAAFMARLICCRHGIVATPTPRCRFTHATPRR